MVKGVGSSNLPPLPTDAYGSGSTPPRNVAEDMYSLVMTLWQMGMHGSNANLNNPFLLTMIAKEVSQLKADLTAEGTLDPASQAILNGINSTQGFDSGSSLGSICDDIAKNGLSVSDLTALEDNLQCLRDLGNAITGSPPSTGPFKMPQGDNWFAYNGLSGDYSNFETTDARHLKAVGDDLQALLADIKAGNWSNVATDIKNLDAALDVTWSDGGDGYITALKQLLETPIPQLGGKSLETMATASTPDVADIQAAFSGGDTVLSGLLNGMLSLFQKWENPPT